MIDEKSRREKRFERNTRIKIRRKHYYACTKEWYQKYPDSAQKARGMHYQTGTLCSCAMCGNPRKFFGEVTLQERSHQEVWKVENDQ